MSDCAEFYRERDKRTAEYVDREGFQLRPIHVAIQAAACESPAGQLALLALANQLVRVHRHITFDVPVPNAVLRVRTPFARSTLGDTLLSMSSEIDPCGVFGLVNRGEPGAVSIGLGFENENGCNFYIGASGATASLCDSPIAFSHSPGTLRGSALASCLGAAAIFRSVLDLRTSPRTLSCWNYLEGDRADAGPDSLEPVDVGRVLMVGAGAVAASLTYWLYAFGVAGDWTVVDADEVKLHNINRGLVFTANDAGWLTASPTKKAKRLGSLIPGARFFEEWYDQCNAAMHEVFDVVLGLANDRNVRHLIASRNTGIALQATTGRNWLSQLHRHILGIDDCIWCRTGEIENVEFGCSTTPVEDSNRQRNDAALPFLSAASGLMLATALQQLQAGALAVHQCNDWRWDFGSLYRMATCGHRSCRSDCTRILSPEVRMQLNKQCRWRDLGNGNV